MDHDITKPPFESAEIDGWLTDVQGGGKLYALECAAAVMMHLGNYLLSGSKKIRVTIECDPETGRFTIKREVIS